MIMKPAYLLIDATLIIRHNIIFVIIYINNLLVFSAVCHFFFVENQTKYFLVNSAFLKNSRSKVSLWSHAVFDKYQ